MIRCRIRSTMTNAAAFIFGAALLGALGSTTLDAQEVQLRWRFEPDAERVYRLVQTSRSSSAMGEINQTQTMTLRHQVLAVAADGAADLRVTYGSMRFVQDGPMGHQEFDSESGESPSDPMAVMLSKLVGVSFEMNVAPDGTVRRVAGVESLIQAMTAGAAGENAQAMEMMRPMLDGMFNDETMRSMMQQGMQSLPDGRIAPGAEWRQTSSLEFPFGTLRSDVDYTLEEIVSEQGRRIARIGIRGNTDQLEPNPNFPAGAAIDMSASEMSGELDFDVAGGLVLRSLLRTNMDMSAAGQAMRTESTIEMTLVER